MCGGRQGCFLSHPQKTTWLFNNVISFFSCPLPQPARLSFELHHTAGFLGNHLLFPLQHLLFFLFYSLTVGLRRSSPDSRRDCFGCGPGPCWGFVSRSSPAPHARHSAKCSLLFLNSHKSLSNPVEFQIKYSPNEMCSLVRAEQVG